MAGTRARLDASLVRLHRQRLRVLGSRVARRAARRRLLAVSLAAIVAWTVTTVVGDAQRSARSWGRTVPVVVVSRALATGDLVTADAVAVVQAPAHFVPDDVVSEPPIGRRMRTAVGPGEMLVPSRLAPAGSGATAAGLEPETQAVTVALGEFAAPVRPGDVVDVMTVRIDQVTLDANTFGASGIEAVARSAVVMWVGDTAATLQVRDDQVRATVGAAATGPLSLVIVG